MTIVWDVYRVHYKPEDDKLPTLELLKKGFSSEQAAKDWVFRTYNLMVLNYRDFQIWNRMT